MATHVNSRSIIASVVLIAGLLAVYAPQIAPILLGQSSPEPEELEYIVDLDYWQRTNRETAVKAIAHFDLDSDLHNVPLHVGEWVGIETPESNEEVIIMLDPEQYVQRLYRNNSGQYIWLSMIGGRSSKPFHPPDICYDADGWQYNLSSRAVTLDGGGEIHGLTLQAQKVMPNDTQPTEHIVFYFYLFPDRDRELQNGIVLFKLTSPQYGSLDETLDMHSDFVRRLFLSAGVQRG
jgi:hypothetical protein